MTDPHPRDAEPAPRPLFSAQRHSDATPSADGMVPGNVLPTFLAARPAESVNGSHDRAQSC